MQIIKLLAKYFYTCEQLEILFNSVSSDFIYIKTIPKNNKNIWLNILCLIVRNVESMWLVRNWKDLSNPAKTRTDSLLAWMPFCKMQRETKRFKIIINQFKYLRYMPLMHLAMFFKATPLAEWSFAWCNATHLKLTKLKSQKYC